MPVAFLRKPTSISPYGLFEWELILTVGFLLKKNTRKTSMEHSSFFPAISLLFANIFHYKRTKTSQDLFTKKKRMKYKTEK